MGRGKDQEVVCYALQGPGLPLTPLDSHDLEAPLC